MSSDEMSIEQFEKEEEILLNRLKSVEDSVDTALMAYDANIPGATPPGYLNEEGMPVGVKAEPSFSPEGFYYYSGRRPEGEGIIGTNEFSADEIELISDSRYGTGFFSQGDRDTVLTRRAQEILFRQGFLDNVEDIDGLWGPKTKGAVNRVVANNPYTMEQKIVRYFKEFNN
tara:strand:+ start:2398 stop:2913 length:516 start_codon:yes stop_codon:yes gene_type:complete